MLLEATKEFEFCAAHHLEGHPKCGKMHGHNYRVLITFRADSNEDMVVDFGEIKKWFGPVIDGLDHSDLNDVIKYPTAENISKHIWHIIMKSDWVPPRLKQVMHSITVYETPTSFVRYIDI